MSQLLKVIILCPLYYVSDKNIQVGLNVFLIDAYGHLSFMGIFHHFLLNVPDDTLGKDWWMADGKAIIWKTRKYTSSIYSNSTQLFYNNVGKLLLVICIVISELGYVWFWIHFKYTKKNQEIIPGRAKNSLCTVHGGRRDCAHLEKEVICNTKAPSAPRQYICNTFRVAVCKSCLLLNWALSYHCRLVF